MSTSNVIMDPANEQVDYSKSDLALIIDLTIWNRMPYIPARRLFQLNCNRWPVLRPYNIKRIVEVRKEDDTRDWYFPTIVKKVRLAAANSFPPDYTWSWSGIWHSTADHVLLQRTHTLPPMTYLPHECIRSCLPSYDIIAASGGLLLIMMFARGNVPIRRSSRLNPRLVMDSSQTSTSRSGSTWQRLVVCNPFTKECRELPAAGDCRHLGYSSWEHVYLYGTQAYMVVQEDMDSYEVTLIFKDFACVYKSTCNTWTFSPRFAQPRPWGPCQFQPGVATGWGYDTPWAHADGRFYFADMRSLPGANADMDPIHKAALAGSLKLFEMEAEAGKWTLLHTYTVRKFHLPFLNRRVGSVGGYDMNILQFMELAECMGDLYAVIPARLHDVLILGQKQTDRWRFETFDCIDMGTELEYMPIVFYIVKLQPGDGLDHGALRIQIPQTTRDIQSRRKKLLEFTSEFRPWWMTFFSCHVKGSVIWVSCDDDYLLSYDVATWESKTQIIPLDLKTDETLRFAYRPSFHMKP